MRINETLGIYSMFEDLSPEVIRAQRLAELEQIARYRALKLAQFKAWADDTQRGQIKEKLFEEEVGAKALMAGKTVYLPRHKRLDELVSVTELPKKPPPKESWWKGLLAWMKRRYATFSRSLQGGKSPASK